MDKRRWMYDGRTSQWEFTEEWKEKAEQFVNRAFAIPSRPIKVFCPCTKCRNTRRQDKDTLSTHLIKHGFTPDYQTWTFHGEKLAKRARTESQQSQ